MSLLFVSVGSVIAVGAFALYAWPRRSAGTVLITCIGLNVFMLEFEPKAIAPQVGSFGQALVLGSTLLLSSSAAFMLWRTGWRIEWPPAAKLFAVLGLLGVVTAPWSIAPFVSVSKSIVALLALWAVGVATQLFGFTRVAQAVVVGLAGVISASLVWELIGVGAVESADGAFRDTGVAGLPRLRGVTEHHNQLGRLGGISACLALVVSRLPDRARWFVPMAYGVGFVGLFMSQSRTSMIAVAVVFLAVRRAERRLTVPVLGAVLMSTLLLTCQLSGISLIDLVVRENAGYEELLSGTGRVSIWQAAWTLAWEHPIFGSGAFTATERMQIMMSRGAVTTEAVDPHNLFLNTFLTQGLVGTALLLGFGATIWRTPFVPNTPQHAARLTILAFGLWSLAESLLPGVNANVVAAGLLGFASTSFASRSSDADAGDLEVDRAVAKRMSVVK